MESFAVKNKLIESDKKNMVKNLLIIFFAIQPLLEIILELCSDKYFEIGGISVATLIRYGIIGVIVVATLIITFDKRTTKIFICYLVAVAIYTVLQWLNLKDYNVTIMDVNMQKGLVQTALYVSKYAMPMVILYEVFVLDFDMKDLKKTVLAVSIFISASMIISNLFGVDNVSYSFADILRPDGSVLSWFGNEYTGDWKMYTSRGLFRSGNQLSSLFSLLLPVVLWIALNSKKVLYYVIVFFHLFAMLMMGTRVAVYGSLVLSVCVLVIWGVELFINKRKFDVGSVIKAAVLFCVFAIVFVQSPFSARMKSGQAGFDNSDKPSDEIIESNKNPNKDEEDIIRFEDETAESVAKKYWIPLETITEDYKFEEHFEFWKHVVFEVDFNKRDDARDIKLLVLKDIFSNKNGALDGLVGIGEVPIYPERDFMAQKYYIGYLGVLMFIIPFLVIIVWNGMKCLLLLLKKKFDGSQCIYLLASCFVFCVAYVAGHTLEPIFVNIYTGLLGGMMLQFIVNKEKIKDEE